MALAIQSGRVEASWILTRLNSYSRRNIIYRAFRELGRALRTIYLLRWIDSAYSAESERGFHVIVNSRCVSGPMTPIWDQVFTMTSVTDGFQLCRARIRSRRGMSVWRASFPAEPEV